MEESKSVQELKDELIKKNEQLANTLNISKEFQHKVIQKDIELNTLKNEYILLQNSLNRLNTKSNVVMQRVQACIRVDGIGWVLFQTTDNKPVTLHNEVRIGWR